MRCLSYVIKHRTDILAMYWLPQYLSSPNGASLSELFVE
jgi:hypothetical protein